MTPRKRFSVRVQEEHPESTHPWYVSVTDTLHDKRTVVYGARTEAEAEQVALAVGNAVGFVRNQTKRRRTK